MRHFRQKSKDALLRREDAGRLLTEGEMLFDVSYAVLLKEKAAEQVFRLPCRFRCLFHVSALRVFPSVKNQSYHHACT